MNGIFLIIGGNLGHRAHNLNQCLLHIQQYIGQIIKQSNIYETASWGKTENPAYLNQVLQIQTSLTPQELIQTCLSIENLMGRNRTEKWASRIIDIDILFYNKQIIHEEHLTIPHPFLHERRFTLLPLNEIAHDFIHPVLQKSISKILLECKDNLQVLPYLPN